ncbi:MAG: flagellar hook-basal body complex protein FliE [Candidatus Margulisiibacteriota bacterium]
MAINPVNADLRLAQLLGDDLVAQAPATSSAAPLGSASAALTGDKPLSSNMFDDILNKSIEALNGVSKSEFHANQMIERYSRGEVELHDVMVAQSKMSVMVQMAVTTINGAVNTFKEITQMQI